MSNLEENIKIVIESFIDGFEQGTVEKNNKAYLKLKELYEKDEQKFLESFDFAIMDLNTLVGELITVSDQKNKYLVPYIANGLYDHFFRKLMEKKEGSANCVDKARFIVRMTLKALKENKNLSLYEDYIKCDWVKEEKEKQAYWSPRTIPDTDTAMKMFWDWYLLRN